MENPLLEALARIAGIGGVVVGILLIIFREVLKRSLFSRLSPEHSYQLLRLIILFTGIVAVTGLTAWAIMRRDPPPAPQPPTVVDTARDERALVAQMRVPIDNLFKAWPRKDLDLYMAQWHPNGLQWAGKTSRSVADIREKRRADFARFRVVQVQDWKVEIDNPSGDPVNARVTYTMRYQRPDGTWLTESNVKETYRLTHLKAENRWVISENFDYIVQ